MIISLLFQITPSSESVIQFLHRTLFHVQNKANQQDLEQTAKDALQKLLDLNLITQKRSRSDSGETDTGNMPNLEVTRLGKAVFKGELMCIMNM